MDESEQQEDQPRDWLVILAIAGTVIVVIVALVVSFAHMWHVSMVAGESWRSWLLPLSVDGLMISATAAMWAAKRRGEEIAGMTLVAIIVGLAVSLAANVVAPMLPQLVEAQHGYVPRFDAAPDTAATQAKLIEMLSPVVAAWPPIALFFAGEELLRTLRGNGDGNAAAAAAGVPEGAAGVRQSSPEAAARVWAELPQAAIPRQSPAAGNDRLPREAAERQGDDQRVAADAAGSAGDLAAGNDRLPREAAEPAAESGSAATAAASVPEDAAEQTSVLPVLAAEGEPVEDPRAAARQLVRQDPEGWTGKELAERFGRSERWGRDQLAAARAELEAAYRPQLVAVQD